MSIYWKYFLQELQCERFLQSLADPNLRNNLQRGAQFI